MTNICKCQYNKLHNITAYNNNYMHDEIIINDCELYKISDDNS